MKKILLTLTAVTALTFASKAQEFGFKPGNVIVEGNLGFNSNDNKTTEVKTSGFKFNPKAGYFINDKFAVGLGLNFNTTTTDRYGLGLKTVEDSFGAHVFGRYYFLELGSRFKTYTELAVGYEGLSDKTTTAGVTVDGPKVNKFGVNAGLGANYFLTDKIAVNFAFANLIGFNSSKAKGGKATSEFNVNINQFNNFFNTAQFGLTFKF